MSETHAELKVGPLWPCFKYDNRAKRLGNDYDIKIYQQVGAYCLASAEQTQMKNMAGCPSHH